MILALMILDNAVLKYCFNAMTIGCVYNLVRFFNLFY